MITKSAIAYCISGWLTVAAAFSAGAGNWPGWRGPDGNALSEEKKLPAEWGPDKNIAWKVALPGAGWSQPIVWGDKIFVTTAETDKQSKPRGEQFDPGFGFFGGVKPPAVVYRWKVLCLDGATGKVLWEQTAHEDKPRTPISRNNTYASETPVTDGERLIAYFGNTGLYCYDLSGKFLWSKDLGAYPMQMSWGTGSSPVLYGDRVFIQ
jgi:outer membrane protein assembly factor BamB